MKLLPQKRKSFRGRLPLRWLACCLPVALALAISLGPGVSTAAPREEWSTPESLSTVDPRLGGWFPAVTADPYGGLHVVWQAGGESSGASASSTQEGRRIADRASWLMYRAWDGQAWSPPNAIAATFPADNALRSALASDRSGRLHLVFRGLDLANPRLETSEGEPQRYASVHVPDAGNAAAWAPTVALSQRTPAYFPDLTVDSRGVIHVVWTELAGGAGYGLYYRRSGDGGRTWSPPRAIETEQTVFRWRAQLRLGPGDSLHVVYEISDGGEPDSRESVGFVYATSRDGGASWTRTAFVPRLRGGQFEPTVDGTRWRQQPAVAVDRRGQVVLVWRESGTNLIYFQVSGDGQNWSEPRTIPGIARGLARPFDRYDLAPDSAGTLHLLAVGYPQGSSAMSLLHSEWSGLTWSAQRTVRVAASAPFPEWPRLAVTQGNRLHAVWFGGDKPDIDRTPMGIWHSTLVTDAPFVAPLARPVVSPTPAAPAATSTSSIPLRLEPLPATKTNQPARAQLAGQPASAGSEAADLESSARMSLPASLAGVGLLLAGAYAARRSGLLS